jgi:transposase
LGIFSKKSEKIKDSNSKNLNNKQSLESFFDNKSAKDNKPKEKQKRSRKFPDTIPREEIHHDLKESEKICNCGTCLTSLGEEISERLDYTPAKCQASIIMSHSRQL